MPVIPPVITAATQATVTLNEGVYKWRVQGNRVLANNQTSSTPFSVRNITIDTTAPDAPVPTAPFNGQIVDSATSATLEWTNDVNSTAPVTDQVFIYSDSLSTLFEQVNNATSPYNVTGLLPNTKYWWRAISTDAAGNQSDFSATRTFTTQ